MVRGRQVRRTAGSRAPHVRLCPVGNNAPIGDVSEWLGHKDVNTTYATYRHTLPKAPVKAIAVLDTEYETWRNAA